MQEIYLRFLIEIVNKVLKGEKLKGLPEHIDENVFLSYATFNRLEQWIYEAVDPDGSFSPEFLNKAEEAYNRVLYFEANQSTMLQLMSDTFDENNVKYIVLKGGRMKKYYPSPLLRQSTDIDIYVYNEDLEKADKLILELGAQKLRDEEIHYTYRFGKFVLVEMHFNITGDGFPWSERCNEIYKYAKNTEKSKYELSLEDFYFHMIAHCARHFVDNEMDIRNLLDIYIFKEKFKTELDNKEIEARMKESRLVKLEKELSNLAYYWFGGKAGSKTSKQLDKYFAELFFEGKFNSMLNEKSASQGTSGKQLIIRQVFLPLDKMQEKYMILSKLPFLLPFCWIHRVISTALFRKDTFKRMKQSYSGIDSSKGEENNRLKKSLLNVTKFENRG